MNVQNLIIGAWITWITLAERLADKWESVLLIEKRSHIGGNCYDYYDKHWILIHKYWPHIFRTNFEQVKNYISKFTSLLEYQHKNIQFVDWLLVPFPFNLNSLYLLFPTWYAERLESIILKYFQYNTKLSILEFNNIISTIEGSDKEDLLFLSSYITEKTFKNYVIKQRWLEIDQVDPSIFDRVPINISRDDRAYSNKKYQWLPEFWYTQMFENMLKSKKISILLNTDYKDIISEIQYDRLICTSPIDEFFDYKYWTLDYKKTFFHFETYDLQSFQEGPVISYPNDYDFTRITEFKKLYPKSPTYDLKKTVICKEYPLKWEENAYPVEIPENINILQKYIEASKSLKNIYFLWRLASYKYQDMDITFKNALDLFDLLK